MESFPHGVHGIRKYSGIANDGHEIGVAFPSGHDMAMQVAGYAGSGSLAKVKANIEAGWLKSASQYLFCFYNYFNQKLRHFHFHTSCLTK